MADSQQSGAPPAGGTSQDPASQGSPAAPALLQVSSSALPATSTMPASSASLQSLLTTSSAPPEVAPSVLAASTSFISPATTETTPSGAILALPSATSTPTASATTSAAACTASAVSGGAPASSAATTTAPVLATTAPASSGDATALMLRPTPAVPSPSALQTAQATVQSAPATSTISGSLHTVEASRYQVPSGQRLPYEPCCTPWHLLTPPGQVIVPATLEDLRDGALMACAPDGLSCLLDVTQFSSAELTRLSVLMGRDAASDLLQLLSGPPPDITDPRIRAALDREMIPLAQSFGVDQLASRTFRTTQYLQQAVQFIQALERPSSGGTSVPGVTSTDLRSQFLAQALKRQSDAHKAELQRIQAAHAVALQTAAAGASGGRLTDITAAAEIQKLKDDLDKTFKLGSRYCADKIQAEDDLEEAKKKIASLESELTASQERIADLETQIQDSRAFDPGALCDFLFHGSAFKGNWRRLLELLQLYRTGKPAPASYRTTIQVSARDLDFEDSEPYTAQAAQSNSAQPPASSLSGPAQAVTTPTSASLPATPSGTPPVLSLGRSSSTGSGKQRRKALKSLPLAKALAPSSSRKAGGLKIKTSAAPSSSAAPVTVDLTRSASSTPKAVASVLKPFAKRIALPRRPSSFKPERKNAKKESPNARSDLDSAKAVPNQFSWDGTRADVRELMLAGVAFWDAVDEVQKDQMLHDQFGKRHLIYMLASAMYWEALDSTPWMRYVPDKYFDAAAVKIQAPDMVRIPEPWRELPKQSSSNDADSESSFMSVMSSEDTDDDDDDLSYHGAKTKTPSSISTRSQSSPAGTKRQRSSTSSSGGSGSKRSRVTSAATGTSADQEPDDTESGEAGVDNGVIEAPKRGSWFHYGIRVQKQHHQTIGFPAYMPSKTGIEQLHKRTEYAQYLELLRSNPWDDMWEGRVSSLVYHTYAELSTEMCEAIVVIAGFMSAWRRAYWERLHWYPFPSKIDFAQLAKDLNLPELASAYRERKDRAQEFELRRRDLLDQLQKVKGYSDRLWYEPGLWVVPKDPCHWILRDPKLKISLADQLFTLDDQEPVRTQWATCRSETQFQTLVPSELKLKSRAEQDANPIIPAPMYDHDTLEQVLRAMDAEHEEESE